MNRSRFNAASVLIALAAWCAQAAAGAAQPPPPPSTAEAAEVLTRGPVHEAYAAPVATGSVTSLVVPKQPPDPIEEVPPDVKPEGEDAIWINGYWAWDDDRKDFVWVSGVWRVPPAGQTWVAGYWAEADGAWRWVPGFWTAVETQQVAYYSQPPDSIEQGPTSDPPSAQHFWIPGCWLWHETRYVWRPGYWAPGHENWVWIPASYCWSPRGWIFVAGYWDYPFRRRGLLFAPVYYTRPVWRAAHYTYSPSVVVDLGVLAVHLFVRPHYCHYYFGDYYAPAYDRLGFYPWFAIHRHRDYHYDPIFTYYRWYNRERHPQWEEHLRGWHRYFREHEDMRPPHTLAQQEVVRRRIEGRADIDRTTVTNVVNNITVAASVRELRQRPDARVRLTELAPEQRKQIADLSRELRDVRTQRRKLELQAVAAAKPEKPGTPGAAKTEGPRKPEQAALPRMPDPARIRTALRSQPSEAPATLPGARPGVPKKSATAPPPALKPGVPTVPDRPRPGATGKPEVPGKPALPAKPEVPGRLRAPGRPEIPATPAIPEKPAAPGKAARVPGKSGTPAVPPSKLDRDLDDFAPAAPPRSPGVPRGPGGGTRPDRAPRLDRPDAGPAGPPSGSRSERPERPERRGRPERSGKPDRP